MSVRRLGGGYGGKLQHPSRVASAAAVAALTLNKPVRLVLGLHNTMTLLGNRNPYLIQYQVCACLRLSRPGENMNCGRFHIRLTNKLTQLASYEYTIA